jgi:hypothetical protein
MAPEAFCTKVSYFGDAVIAKVYGTTALLTIRLELSLLLLQWIGSSYVCELQKCDKEKAMKFFHIDNMVMKLNTNGTGLYLYQAGNLLVARELCVTGCVLFVSLGFVKKFRLLIVIYGVWWCHYNDGRNYLEYVQAYGRILLCTFKKYIRN